MKANALAMPTHLDSPELAKLESLIESGFTHDWLLRIEHASGSHAPGNSWQEWGQPAFAITDASTVVASVAECRATHPTHSIRLRAEKLHPRTQMLYCVFKARKACNPSEQTVPAAVAGMPPANDHTSAVDAVMLSIGNRGFLAAAAIGILMSSLLMAN